LSSVRAPIAPLETRSSACAVAGTDAATATAAVVAASSLIPVLVITPLSSLSRRMVSARDERDLRGA
jgi:hypothetical protein